MDDSCDIFLLIGQSNMAGRGRLEDVPPLSNPRIFMFRNRVWVTAQEPLHTDRPDIAGAGLAMSFAMGILEMQPDRAIGLIPCAVGGTPLSRWAPGADLFERAVAETNAALADCALQGILWHQGENDSNYEQEAKTYGERFSAMIAALRTRLGAETVPVIAGELGHFLRNHSGGDYFEEINGQLHRLMQRIPRFACVSAKGLTAHEDNLHFDASSLREFGERYARAWRRLTQSVRDQSLAE